MYKIKSKGVNILGQYGIQKSINFIQTFSWKWNFELIGASIKPPEPPSESESAPDSAIQIRLNLP